MTKEYYNSLLSLYNIKENTNSLSTTGTKRPPITTGQALSNEEHSTYRANVGKLLWMCPLRPDIQYHDQYATKKLTRAVQKPHDKQNAKHLLRYLHGSRNYKLHLKPKQPTNNDPYIKAYCDSGWAGCTTTRKSTIGTVLQFAGVTIATSSKTQQTIAQSSAEAELYAIGTTVNDVIYVRNFLNELNFTTDDASLRPRIYTDSSSAKCLTQQLGLTKSAKHIISGVGSAGFCRYEFVLARVTPPHVGL
eukprot:5004520-Amphidinium_carterae.1